jgi:hypothetical protein
MEQLHERLEVKGINHQEAFPPNALKKTSTLPTLLRRWFRFQQAGMRSESFCNQRWDGRRNLPTHAMSHRPL